MKKIVLLFAACAALCASAATTASAQIVPVRKFEFGINAYGQYAAMTFRANGYSESTSGTAFGGGVFGERVFLNNETVRMRLGAGLGLGYKRMQFEEQGAKMSIDQMIVDLSVGMRSMKERGVGFGLRYGLRGAFLLGVDGESPLGAASVTKEDCNPMQIGFFIGAGATVGSHIDINLELDFMLSNFYKKDRIAGISSGTLGIGLGLAYRF